MSKVNSIGSYVIRLESSRHPVVAAVLSRFRFRNPSVISDVTSKIEYNKFLPSVTVLVPWDELYPRAGNRARFRNNYERKEGRPYSNNRL